MRHDSASFRLLSSLPPKTPTLWSRIRRMLAHALSWLLLLQSVPALAQSVTARQEPRGWELVTRVASATVDWTSRETSAARRGLAAGRQWATEVVASAAQHGAEAWSTATAAVARIQPAAERSLPLEVPAGAVPHAPPLPPGFAAPAASATRRPIVAAAIAGDVPIGAGWSLVSLPTQPAETNPQAVFSGLGSTLRRAFAFDACEATDPWKVYDPTDAAGSDLVTVDETRGLWVDATEAATLASPGPAPLSTTLHLCAGWNLVGFPAEQARPVASALVSIAGRYQRVFGFDAADLADPWEVYDVTAPAWANDLQVLRPGRGYWILASEETDLVIANEGSQLAVEIAQPSQLQEVTGATAVVGTVQGQALAGWELRYRSMEEGSEWMTLAEGATAVTNAPLATFDPTLLLNGMYEIELSALDVDGTGVSLSTHVVVEGQQKIGNFTVSFVDLEVPLAGIPIQVIRTYDSREKRSLDFGYGWTLDVRQGSYRNNRRPGDGWRIVTGFLPCQSAQESKPHLTTVRLSDREVYRFRLRVTSPAVVAGGCMAQASFAFVDGPVPGATLAILGGDTQVFFANGSSELVDPATFEPYEPRAVRLTTRDGRVFDLDIQRGVTRLADTNGNTLQISDTGIDHSSGRSISWHRDGQGRITDLTDPLGQSIVYTYDAAGDLVAVTGREDHTTRFRYDGRHGLLTIEDPRGIQPIRNEYDDHGRLLRHIDAYGKTIELDHRLADHEEVVTDRLGHSRTLAYDDRGNVVREVDAGGGVTERTFDADDLVLSETDPLGHTTTYSYDAGRNLASVRDPLGNTTTYTYDSRGQVLTSTDPRGKTTRNVYDAAGNLLRTTDPLGSVTAYSYDGRGNLLTETDALGAVTAFSYDGYGNLVEQTDALGTHIAFTYDSNGNRLTETTRRTLPSGGQETLVSRFVYDRAGRVVSTEQPGGVSTSTVYDAIGQVAETVDPLGRRTVFTYDELGRQVGTRYPDGTTESRTYDPEGRLETTTDRGGRSTTYLYDELGRLVKTLFVDGTSTSSTYDAAGRLVGSTDARSHTTTYEYDDAGRRTRVLDARGGQTDFEYDSAGNQIAVTDANRNRTIFVYDEGGRMVRTVFPDTTWRETEYDQLGRRVAETDQAGKITRFGFDVLGRLLTVTDALGQVTRYAYDELGSRVAQTDANRHTTRFEYDPLGRMTRRLLPGGAAELLGYDAAGNLTSKTDFAGRTIEFGYDVANRLTTKSYPDTTVIGFTYTSTGRRETMVDGRGTTRYRYDSRDRLAEVVYPDGRKLVYGWDANGNRLALAAHVAAQVLETTFGYDELNRLDGVTDPVGRVYDHDYDANGSRTSLVHPNGVRTTYAYDSLNRLRSLRSETGVGAVVQAYAFTLGAAGNRTRIDEHDGTSRSYGYDALFRLTGETVAAAGASVYSKTFGYDPVGNRLQQVHTDAAGTVTTTNYGYDDRDRLLTEGAQSWTWDANGNLSAKLEEAVYAWDLDDRLQQVTLEDGTIVTHTYDADGVRVRTETRKPDGTTTVVDYLVDSSGGLSQVVGETTSTGGAPAVLSAYYVRGDDLLAVMRPGEGGGWASRFYHADGLGSIRALTDEAGTVTDRWCYTAFGELLSHEGEDPNAYRFAGEALDPNSGWYYNRARWMDPGVGRFPSMDPFAGRTANAITLHKYLYAGLNPISNVDPSGEEFTLSGLLVNLGVQGILRGMAAGFVGGFLIGGADALLRGEDLDDATWAAAKSGLIGAAFGAFYTVQFVRPVLLLTGTGLGVVGVADAIEQDNAALTVFRGVLTLAGGFACFKSLPQPPRYYGGRVGNRATQGEVNIIADRLIERGWTITGGGGKGPEIHLPGPQGQRGGNFIDISATKNGRTIHINTVDTYASGRPTNREAAAAALIRSKLPPGEHLMLVPKGALWVETGVYR